MLPRLFARLPLWIKPNIVKPQSTWTSRQLGLMLGGLLATVALFAVVQFPVIPMHSYFWDRVADTGHMLIFGLLAWVGLVVLRGCWPQLPLSRQYMLAGGAALICGVLLEWWQAKHGRSAEWIDVYNDALGIVVAAAVYAIFDSRIPTPRTGLQRKPRLFCVAVLATIAGLVPLAVDLAEFAYRDYYMFPQLVDFSRPWDRKFYYTVQTEFTTPARPAEWPSSELTNIATLATAAAPDNYPAFVLKEPHQDWTGYQWLEIELHVDVPPEDGSIWLRVHDHLHTHDMYDRFNHRFDVQAGMQTLRVSTDAIRQGPAQRELNMRRITGMAIFLARPQQPAKFSLGEIRLVH